MDIAIVTGETDDILSGTTVEVQAGDSFRAGIPKPLFSARVQPGFARNT